MGDFGGVAVLTLAWLVGQSARPRLLQQGPCTSCTTTTPGPAPRSFLGDHEPFASSDFSESSQKALFGRGSMRVVIRVKRELCSPSILVLAGHLPPSPVDGTTNQYYNLC